MRTSRMPGFYRLSPSERLKAVAEFAGLSDEEVEVIRSCALSIEDANRMIENVIGILPLPLGVATNFLINGRDYLIPMAIEEPSVVAAASNAARMARECGGFKAWATDPLMIGQIQVVKLESTEQARQIVLEHRDEIINRVNEVHPRLVKRGGGAKDVRARVVNTSHGDMLVVEVLIDCRDAMGANIVNTAMESLAPFIERITGGRVILRILSNLATERLAGAKVVLTEEALGGREVLEGIVLAYALAEADPYRCATHNKGIMNGIVAVALATGNDTRALEAGAHAYAARDGRYRPLTHWELTSEGKLVGTIELPLAVGIVGGATRVNPVARVSLKILGVETARELSQIMAAVGLAQNLAALRALVTEGIQRGHMSLHAKNIAATAGARGELIDIIAEIMVSEKNIGVERAKELLAKLTGKQAP